MTKNIVIIALLIIVFLLLYLHSEKSDCYIDKRMDEVIYDANARTQLGREFLSARQYFQLLNANSVDSAQVLIDRFSVQDSNIVFLWQDENTYVVLYKSWYKSLEKPGFVIARDTFYSVYLLPVIETYRSN